MQIQNKTQSYKDLIVWQKAMKISVLVYTLTDRFPKSEIFSLTNQIRRSAVSIPSNIAEGWGRRGSGEYIQFLKIASGSASELETQLILSKQLKFGSLPEYKEMRKYCLKYKSYFM